EGNLVADLLANCFSYSSH
ncbi:hypothetical protein A2U01_0076543, partial [Trifolium medium]|nr:hypothetical protein [Trifolium medium]